MHDRGLVRRRGVVQRPAGVGVENVQALELRYDPERLHVFDADTGRALYHSATTDEAPVMHAGD